MKSVFYGLLVAFGLLAPYVSVASEVDNDQNQMDQESFMEGEIRELPLIAPDAFLEQRTGDVQIFGPTDSIENTEDNINIEIDYQRARIDEVDTQKTEVLGQEVISQTITVTILSGPRQGEKVMINTGGGVNQNQGQIYAKGDVVVVAENTFDNNGELYIHDVYRLPGIGWMAGIFLIMTIIFARWQGLGGLMGLMLSIGILFWYVIPQLVAGQNPTLITLTGTMMIVSVTLFVSHGFRFRTLIALVSTLVTLVLAYGLSIFFVEITNMFGSGSEEVFYLQFAVQSASEVNLDIRGLLLGGILIGMLGVLDDVTVGQSAAMDEIHQANPQMGFKRLYRSGMSVGRDHIASMVNSLALAYVGASLPLFLLLYVNALGTPLWVTINSEFISQEIVRTVAGSSAILLAVPITSVFAAYWYSRRSFESDRDSTKTLRKRTGNRS